MMKWTLAVNPPAVRERGQAMVIVAFAMIALVAFIGFTVDTGILFISNGHLRRAVDAAALSAATQLREGAKPSDLTLAAKEFLALNNVFDLQSVAVETCDYAAVPPTPADLCPDPPRKFVRVKATQIVQFAFLPIIGFGTFPISAESTSEAASVDAVVVIDTSESMCSGNPAGIPNCPGVYDPNNAALQGSPPYYAGCNPTKLVNVDNPTGKCQPLWDAKFASKAFVKKLYDKYDRIAIVTFDYKPWIWYTLSVNLGDDDGLQDGDAYAAIDNIDLHDDAPAPSGLAPGQYTPLNIDCIAPGTMGACTTPTETKSVLSTCGGCGIRVASTLLKATGRPSALWVVIFLSDGGTNVSDVPNDAYLQPGFQSDVPPEFPNGFCSGQIGAVTNNPLWGLPFCTDGGFGGDPFYSDPATRHCGPYHAPPKGGGAATCPPGTIYVGAAGYSGTVYYDVEDYARDFTDFAALTVKCKKTGGEQCTGTGADKYNENEKLVGSNMAIYSIALGQAADPPNYAGEELLRYMAAVGDDGDRVTDSCAGVTHQASCGNYYYSPSGAGLLAIFEDIAKRIFTRLTK